MTAGRAIELLANMELAEKHQGDNEMQEAIHEAIDALEWHIRKKPRSGDVVGQRLCPKCGASLDDISSSHCRDCGQALDWSNLEVLDWDNVKAYTCYSTRTT